MQIIFQDSTSSLNPRMTIADIISEPLKFKVSVKIKQIEWIKYMRC